MNLDPDVTELVNTKDLSENTNTKMCLCVYKCMHAEERTCE